MTIRLGSPCRLNKVFALNGASREWPGGHKSERDIGIDGAEEWDSGSNKDWNTRDDHTLDEARAKKALNRYAAVDVDVLEPTTSK